MKNLWDKLFGAFFGIVGAADFLSILLLYKMHNLGKNLVLKAFPMEYWVIKVGEMSIAVAYILLCLLGLCNRGRTLALLALLFVLLRLLSNVPLLGSATKITLGSIISSLIIYIGGTATVHNLRRC
ncbi:hypothetical protein [Thermococcus sp.]